MGKPSYTAISVERSIPLALPPEPRLAQRMQERPLTLRERFRDYKLPNAERSLAGS